MPVTVEVTREVVTERVVVATPEPPAPCAPTNLADAEEVVVAVLMPLSQSSSLAMTVAVRAGLVLANTRLNEQGGAHNTPVELWWADSGNLPEQGALAAADAILEHCAVALIGSNNSETAAAIDAVAQQYGVPHIIIDGADNSLTSAQSPTLFRLSPNSAQVATMHAEWLAAVGDYNGDGARLVAIVSDSAARPLGNANAIAQALAEHGFAVDTYAVDTPVGDFSSLIARIVAKNLLPDTILVRVNGDSGTLLLRQLLEYGIGPAKSTLLVGPRLFTNADIAGMNGEQNWEWLVVPRVGAWIGMTDERAAPLLEGYTRLFSRWPDSSAFLGYDALLLLADAMERAHSLAPADLVHALETADVDLAGGHYSFPNGTDAPPRGATPNWAWHQWLDQPLLFLQYSDAESSGGLPAIIWPPALRVTDGPVMRPGE